MYDDGYSRQTSNDDAQDDDLEENNEVEWGWTLSQEGISNYLVVFLTLLALTLYLSKFLHQYPRVGSVLPEAGLTVIIGIIFSFFIAIDNKSDEEQIDDDVNPVEETLLGFSSTVFFIALLPPIIFNSGYHLKRSLFFRHLTSITLYACAGTAISTIFVGLMLYAVVSLGWSGDFNPSFSEVLTFGALISATDPVSTLSVFQQKKVDPHLFYLVFGESVLNDAVGLVLFNALSKFVGIHDTMAQMAKKSGAIVIDFAFIFCGSLALGVASGVVCAALFKVTDLRHTRLVELSLYVLVVYFPFFIAEALELSGIVTILFTGITVQRYAVYNISPSTAAEADVIFRLLAHLAETAIFLNLGLSVFEGDGDDLKTVFTLWAVLACLIGRAANVYPLTFFYNSCVKRLNSSKDIATRSCRTDAESAVTIKHSLDNTGIYIVKRNTADMLWFSGLRGAVAYACAETFPDANGNRKAFISITMAIVLSSVFLLGSTTSFALQRLGIQTDVDEEQYMQENKETSFSHFQRFENKYILPLILRDLREDVDQNDKKELLSQFFSDLDVSDFAPSSYAPANREASVEMRETGYKQHTLEVEKTHKLNQHTHSSMFDFGAETWSIN